MKKLIAVMLTLFLVACATSNPGGSETAPKPKKKMLKGSWQVTDIRFVGDQGFYKANLFELTDSACFKGGTWVFIPNNGAGKFSISNSASQCQPSSNRIHWSFYKPTEDIYQFQFKYVNEKGKPVDAANRGYRATIDDLNDAAMVLRVATTYQGNPFDVIMTFIKISDDITL